MSRLAILVLLVACSPTPSVTMDASVDGISDSTSDAGFDATEGGSPFACPTGAPSVVFVTETPPPAKLAPWQQFQIAITWANCGTSMWSKSAIKVGPAAPHDLTTWTPARIALPMDVPPGGQITIPITLHGPALTGPHAMAFELVHDGVAWLGQPSPTHVIDVEPAPSNTPIPICNGVMADATGKTDARAAIQACIDATPDNGTLALPAGIYRLSGVVSIVRPMTVTTIAAGNAPSCLDPEGPRCAVLRADDVVSPIQAGTRGFVRLGTLGMQVAGVTLDHLVVDGNRDARLSSGPASQCAAGNNGDGINIGANCASCKILHVGSARALCGTGIEWDGDGITVQDSVFLANGDHEKNNMWSDGLTIHKSNGAIVDGCAFIDNSDVGFISGGGTNAKYTNNVAMQLSQVSFAAIMLDNFNNGALGDHTGALLSNNSVACPAGCHFGIELGPHPWYASPNILGGTVSGNTVVGANIQINAQGTGTQAAPTVITNNTLGPTPASAKFQCGTVNGLSPLNVSNESVVDLKGGMKTGSINVPCP